MVNDEQEVKINKLKIWLKHRLQVSKQKESEISSLATVIIFLILLIEIWLVVPGISTGLGIIADYSIMTLLYFAAFFFVKRMLVPIFKFLYITHYTSLLLITSALFVQTYLITRQIKWNFQASIVFAIIVTVLSVTLTIFISYMWLNRRKWMWSVLVLIITFILVTIFYIRQVQLDQAIAVVEPEILQDVLIEQQEVYSYLPIHLQENPSEPGPFQFRKIQYDSNDEQLLASKEYDERNQLTHLDFPSVDGSSLLTDWTWAKEIYWKFSEQNISISGELWIPEGEGPFPIVYIMHGNHISETDSSIGYNYLGELLASQGYIVSSIDANFLNFSVWSGIVDNDQLLRGWLFLAHIHSFYYSNLLPIDWSNVALIGHSRGGQAASMAVDIKRWIEDDDYVDILDKVNINAVIAIAPTDYAVDNKFAYLRDTNYLTIHGSLDSDLTEFFGERQFERTTIDDDNYKASVIIYGANHGQFNETWGKYDDQFPAALLLNTEHIVDEYEQQLAAQIFIGGFLKSVFEQKTSYRQLFQDYRVAQKYLPVTGYVTQYEDSLIKYYYTFELEHEINTVKSSSQLKFKPIELKGRNGSSKYNDVLQVEWNMSDSSIFFPITRQHKGFEKSPIQAFVLQVAKTTPSASIDLITDMNIEIDFLTEQSAVSLNLKRIYSLLDPYYPEYLKLDFLEDNINKGKFESKEEPYLQSYIIPVSLIQKKIEENDVWDINQLMGIKLRFKDTSGTMLIDDIGVIYEGGNYVEYE